MTDITLKDLVEKVQAWGDDKKITSHENVDKQYMKFIEEVLEFKTELDLKAYIEKNGLYSDDGGFTITDALGADKEKVEKALKLEMGDILVTLIIMAKQKGYDFVKMYEGQTKHFIVSSDKRFLLLMEKAIDLGKYGLQVNFIEVLSVLQIIAYWNNLYLEDCLSMAYDKIKDRKGKTIDEKIIKEEEL